MVAGRRLDIWPACVLQGYGDEPLTRRVCLERVSLILSERRHLLCFARHCVNAPLTVSSKMPIEAQYRAEHRNQIFILRRTTHEKPFDRKEHELGVRGVTRAGGAGGAGGREGPLLKKEHLDARDGTLCMRSR